MSRVVRIRFVASGRTALMRAESVAVDVPRDVDPIASIVIVTGETLESRGPGGAVVRATVPTRRLGDYFADERCFVPTRERTLEGRTMSRAVVVLESDRILRTGETLDERP